MKNLTEVKAKVKSIAPNVSILIDGVFKNQMLITISARTNESNLQDLNNLVTCGLFGLKRVQTGAMNYTAQIFVK